jgi:CBS domain-containing protein
MTDLSPSPVAEHTARGVVARLPALVSEPLVLVGRREPLTVPPGTSLADCISTIQRSGTSDSVFVAEPGGRLLGVLTERDIFGRLVGDDVASGIDLAAPVETLMTTDPRTLRLDQTVRDAIELMQTGRYRNIPIVDTDGRLVGAVRQVDILRFLAEAFPEDLLNLPPRPHQRMEQAEGG